MEHLPLILPILKSGADFLMTADELHKKLSKRPHTIQGKRNRLRCKAGGKYALIGVGALMAAAAAYKGVKWAQESYKTYKGEKDPVKRKAHHHVRLPR